MSFTLLILIAPFLNATNSICYGETKSGKLRNGVELPKTGSNFESYSTVARIAGRTYVHSEVRTIIIDAYTLLEQSHPDKVFKYAETGYENGGQFKPHKTHQNGLSVDFMTPVTNAKGESVHLPTHPFNRFGYDIEFDNKNQYEGLQMDFEAIAAHIVALHKSAKNRGYDLWRVIFDPKLQPYLYQTQYKQYLRQNIQFSKKPSWVRHDEHYHVDFDIPCEKLPTKL